MGNKILGRRSRSFYRGFNERQVDYLKQKFETFSLNGKLDKKKFMEAYKINEAICAKFLGEVDFDEDSEIDQYEFICMAHSLCSLSIQELGLLLFRILTKSKNDLTQKNLYNFTKTCLQYNSYFQKSAIQDKDVQKLNKNKFEKYNFDQNEVIDEKQFAKMCLKDEDYKKWMFNMGFITKRQMDFQQDVYDLVDSDIGDEIVRHDRENKQNIAQIKNGAEHRLDDDEFQVEQVVGQQSAPQKKPWVKTTEKVTISEQNLQPPNQSLQIDYVFGYRSFDCRNNVKFDNNGKIIYHQAAIGIVFDHEKNLQNYIIEHNDDITCLDIVEDTVVSGQQGAKPCLIVWETNKKQDKLMKKMVITDQLKDGISCVCFSESRGKIAAICNDQNHRLAVYDCGKLEKKQNDPTFLDRGVIAAGNTSANIPFDLKFDVNEKIVVLATIRQLLFISFDKGVLNANRGTFGNFTVTSALCLLPLKCEYKGQIKNYMISGMGNGSLYFWENEVCVKSISGHQGSVSAICARKDTKSFVSGDKAGNIILWNDKFQKEKTIIVPKSNSLSNMVVSLSCSRGKQLLVGTKGSDIYVMRLGDGFDRAKKVMSGHNDGQLWGLAVHQFIYTGGQDQRLIKWQYLNKRGLQKQRKCQYPIRSIDIYSNQRLKEQMLVVGYKNGVVECFDSNTLESLERRYTAIKNPDEEVLNLIKVNKDGTMCIACYQYPKFKIALLNLARKDHKQLQLLSEIPVSSKVIAVDFDLESTHIRFNTAHYEYLVYNIDNFAKPVQVHELKFISPNHVWATHTLPYSPQTQGIFSQGVMESDIVCCDRTRKYFNVFVVGDKYSKIKLFNYPSKENKIYNRYVGHSNEVTRIQFDAKSQYVISLGGEQKSVIVWKYNPEYLKNEWFISKLPEADIEMEVLSEERLKKKKLLSEYDAEGVVGEQAMATKAFAGQIKLPRDFKEKYNARRDNKVPEEDLSIKHVFGLRNKYISDQVRNQVRFSSSFKEALFPTACLGIKMGIQSKQQEFYHAHREDIVSFAVDPTRKIMATGQMAQKNPVQPRKKIVSIYVWDINGKNILNKLDGFHTVAVVLLSFSPNSKLLFSCGNDEKNTFAIYDWISGTVLYSGPTSRSKVNGITWKTNEQFMTCGMDHVKFWDGPKSRLGKTQGKVEAMFSCVSSKSIYITGSGDGGLYNWLGQKSGNKIKAHEGKVHTLVFNKDYIYSGGDDGKINAWRTAANGEIKSPQLFFDTRVAYQQMLKTVKNIPQQEFGVLSIDFGQKNELLIGTVGAAIIYKTDKRCQVIHQGHYRGQLWGLSTQVRKNNDNYIVTGGDDKSVRIWDIEAKKQVTRLYFQDKIRGLDWSMDGSKIAIADSRAKIYLYNHSLSTMLDSYEGKPYKENKDKKIDPFVEDIKFSPDCRMLAYGSHGQSLYMQILDADGKLKNRATFPQGSSALLHVDWSKNSDFISINSQAYELLFFDKNGGKVTASSLADEQWATWTRKIGFQVKGIFQGVDYTDVNTVCRDPTSKFIAVGYDDQCIRLFKYPCYIEKQVCKMYPGHSSHVTRVKFTSNYLVSLGGLDRSIIVWNVIRPEQKQMRHDGQQSDGLDDLQEDVDLPNKAITRKPKAKKIQEFYQVQDEGDEFMAVKPWLGAIKEPTYQFPAQTTKKPDASLKLEYVHGYRTKDCRQNLYYNDKETIIFHAAAVLIYHNIDKNEQLILDPHQDDILSIDYHRGTNQVITGELGPKPFVCLFRDAKLVRTFIAPVKKGVLALAFNPDGKRAACAGMDDDHEIAILDLDKGTVVAKTKGTKKVITKILWTSLSNFVTVGICHYKFWAFDGKLSGKESPKRYNFVSVVYDDQTKKIFAGASKGTIIVWSGTDADKNQISLTREAEGEIVPASIVDCLLIQKGLLLAGTKDGFIYVIDKKTREVKGAIAIQDYLDVKSQCPSVRSMCILGSKLLIGTLGSQIYEIQMGDLTLKKPFKACKNILKCHYSPNNTWTNQIWGLAIHDDYIFTCSDDATLRCWSIYNKKLLSCVSTNVYESQGGIFELEKDKSTKDFTDAAKSRAVAVSPDGKDIVVGAKNGTIRVYSFSKTDQSMRLKTTFRHAQQWISDIKFGYKTLIIGSHDNAIYVYDYEEGKLKRKFAPMKKHSSYITHVDVSRDSCFLQSTCGAYELLFWDLNTGKQITAGATLLRDERWMTWTCNLGWPVQGIYPKCEDGTFINSVDRSNFSINTTVDTKSPYLLAVGNDSGKVCLYNYPCTIKSSDYVEGRGHSSHVTNVRWNKDDKYVISVGGEDQCLMYWKVSKK